MTQSRYDTSVVADRSAIAAGLADAGVAVNVSTFNRIASLYEGIYRDNSGGYYTPPDIYVDGVAGSDSYDGRTQLTPYKTLAKALTAVGATANKTIGIKCGSVLREKLLVGSTGLRVIPYGSGALPRLLGSVRIAASWTLVTGTEYKTAFAYTPRGVFVEDPSTGAVTKLYDLGTAGSLTSGQFDVSGGFLNINVGADPSTLWVEVPLNTSDVGVSTTNNGGLSVYGLVIRYFPQSGCEAVYCDAKFDRCEMRYNCNDGADFSGVGSYLWLRRCLITNNGTHRAGAIDGPGDGISGHHGGSGLVEYCVITDNEQTGIGNEADSTCVSRYNYLRNNIVNLKVYAGDGDTYPGSHAYYGNIVACTATDNFMQVEYQGATFTVTGAIYNNTFYSETGGGRVTIDGGDWVFKNNILAGGSNYMFSCFNGNAGHVSTCVSSYNLYANTGSTYQPSFGPTTIGAGEVKTSQAAGGFVSAATGDFNLLSTSPAFATGNPAGMSALGILTDYSGNAYSLTAPCRGAIERLAT